ALHLAEAGVKVVAVADQYGAVHRPKGLDIEALQQHVADTGSVTGFAGADPLEAQALLELEVDLLVPAAVEGVLNESNAHRIRAGIIVEGANGPTTAAADAVFEQAGKLVVPDILANAGGVIVSYFEWVQGSNAYWWSAQEVDERLEARMLAAWDGVTATAAGRGLSLREAATVTAVQKVAEAHQIRGLYP
ncbi:glutamate dehydrogenase (NAD(P)+), partial [Arthrobacter crystallopoietes BAB-32]